MSSYWHTHIPAAQALAWIERALAPDPDGCHLSAGWSALWAATFAWQIGDLDTMMAFEDRARWIWTELGSEVGLAWVDYSVATRLGIRSRHREARRLHEANLHVFRRAGDVEGIVKSLCGLSCTHLPTGEPTAAIAALEEALDVSREHDNLVLQSHVLARLPEVLLYAGEIERAEAAALAGERLALLVGDRLSLPWPAMARAAAESSRGNHLASLQFGQRAVSLFQDAGDRLNEWGGHMASMVAAVELGDEETARAHAIEAIALLRRHCGEEDMASGLAGLAGLALTLGHPLEALIACAASASFLGSHGLTVMPGTGQRATSTAETARASLPPADAESWWRLGEHGGVAAALDRIEQCLDEPASARSIPA
jgi:tetratricopeptide (TPR) repeat protein